MPAIILSPTSTEPQPAKTWVLCLKCDRVAGGDACPWCGEAGHLAEVVLRSHLDYEEWRAALWQGRFERGLAAMQDETLDAPYPGSTS